MPSTETPPRPPDYVRVQIQGRLRVMSELHVGDGSSFDADKRGSVREISYLTVCTDAQGVPYLPGNTLRGALRAQASEARLSKEVIKKLFGPYEIRSAVDMEAGSVRVRDAFLEEPLDPKSQHYPYWSAERNTLLRSEIAIDAVTGTTREGALFHHEMVPRGMSFGVKIDCVDVCKEALEALLGLLERWDGSIRSGIGAGRGKGWGLLQWCLDRDKSKVLRRERYKQWIVSEKSMEDFMEPLENRPAGQQPRADIVTLLIRTCSPLLVNEPGFVREKRSSTDARPEHEYSRTPEGKPMIPASTLRGLLRARARRIVMTLLAERLKTQNDLLAKAADFLGPKANELIAGLFGDTGRRGTLWIGEAIGPASPPAVVGLPRENHEANARREERSEKPTPTQYFNAIDRFTGGVSGKKGEGKLYDVRAIHDATVFKGQACIEPRLLEPRHALKGLLLLVLRDALEGDLRIGWGKARGYGAFELELQWGGKTVKTWEQLRAILTELARNDPSWDAGLWIKDLHAELDALTK